MSKRSDLKPNGNTKVLPKCFAVLQHWRDYMMYSPPPFLRCSSYHGSDITRGGGGGGVISQNMEDVKFSRSEWSNLDVGDLFPVVFRKLPML